MAPCTRTISIRSSCNVPIGVAVYFDCDGLFLGYAPVERHDLQPIEADIMVLSPSDFAAMADALGDMVSTSVH